MLQLGVGVGIGIKREHGVFEGVGGVDLGSRSKSIGVGVFGGEGHGVFGAEAGAFVSFLMLAPEPVAVLFPVRDVLMVEAGVAEVGEVFGDLFEGDTVGEPFAYARANLRRKMGDFASGGPIGGGITPVDWKGWRLKAKC